MSGGVIHASTGRNVVSVGRMHKLIICMGSNVVCRPTFQIIMMHASGNILFEKIHILAAILSNNLHNLCKKMCLLNN